MDITTNTSEQNSAVPKKKSVGKLEKISFIILLITIILTPPAFVPSVYTSTDTIKTIVITVGVLVSAILYSISLLKNRDLTIPKHSLFTVSLGIIASVIVSTLLSTSVIKSLFGQGFEVGTASMILVLFLASLLTVYFTNKDKDRLFYVYGAVFITFVIVALYHIARFIGGADFLTLGVFQNATSTMLGKWNDLALFSGLVGILSYITLRSITLSKAFKIVLVILSVISAVFLILINSSLIWALVAIVTLLLAIYEFSISTVTVPGISGFLKKIPVITAIVVIVSVVFFWKGDVIVSGVITKMGIGQTEVVLPWQLTIDVASETIKESPLFGAGPNRFGVQYLRFKPIVVNPTVFWNAEFSTGFGFLPTFTVTQGLVGLVLWIVLMIIFAYTGSKSLRKVNDGVSRYFIMSSFFSALFLWIAAIVYVPSHSILIMTFVFSGLFLASLINNGQVSLVSLRRDDGKGATKFIPAILLVIIAITIIWLAVFVKKTIALGYFHGGISSFNLPEGKGLADAEAKFMKALAFDKVDTYYQAMSEINISKITLLAQKIQAEASQKGSTADPEAVKQLGKLIDDALQYTRDAIAADPTNYYNNLAEARISEVALSLQIQNAYETTRNAYANALRNNPYNPSIYLSLARVEASQNKIEEAQKDIGLALQLKQNYLDAIFLLSQIQVSQGQIKEAITSVQVASQINPENPQIFFQLGLLYYNDKNYTSAVDAFTKAVKLDNKYANAQYFLGLSYARLNKFADAIIQFENLSVSNPDNEEVALILKNLKAGKSPFADAKPPIDSKPEQRKSLPIKSK